jgi:molecular chaperone GrpE
MADPLKNKESDYMAATKKKKDTAETSEVEMNSEELLKALEEKNKETEKLTKEKDEYLLIAQRLQADFDNFRKRNNSVREESYNEGIIDTIKKILPIVDDLNRAIAVEEANGTTGQLFDGMKLINKQLHDVLSAMGVAEIQAVGLPFDPELHEAIASVEAQDGAEPETVFDELRKGYTYKEKVIRHSMVRVNK